MITEIDILEAVRDTLKASFGKKTVVYLDDIQENFKTPCFSLQIITTESPHNRATNQLDCNLYIDYISDLNDKDAVKFYQIKNQLRDLFVRGFQVKDRYIHTNSIQAETSGENKDFIEVKLDFSFLQAIPDNEPGWMMNNFYDKYKS